MAVPSANLTNKLAEKQAVCPHPETNIAVIIIIAGHGPVNFQTAAR
jgi:hypothetical protein